jgi:hypothetical protein
MLEKSGLHSCIRHENLFIPLVIFLTPRRRHVASAYEKIDVAANAIEGLSVASFD